MSAAEGTIRRCDHPGCTATYDAAAVMNGQASAAGWTTCTPRGEHYCFAHQGSPVLAAQRWLRGRHGPDWHTVLATKPGPWAREDLRDFLTCLPTMSGVWRRMAAEVLDVLDADTAGSATRIEWGHRLDPSIPSWAEFHLNERAMVRPCRHEGRCPLPKVGAHPAVHVWREVREPSGWRTGTPPEATP